MPVYAMTPVWKFPASLPLPACNSTYISSLPSLPTLFPYHHNMPYTPLCTLLLPKYMPAYTIGKHANTTPCLYSISGGVPGREREAGRTAAEGLGRRGGEGRAEGHLLPARLYSLWHEREIIHSLLLLIIREEEEAMPRALAWHMRDRQA